MERIRRGQHHWGSVDPTGYCATEQRFIDDLRCPLCVIRQPAVAARLTAMIAQRDGVSSVARGQAGDLLAPPSPTLALIRNRLSFDKRRATEHNAFGAFYLLLERRCS